MAILVCLLKLNLKFVYFFLKLFPTNNSKIVFISRQSNKPSIDFILLQKKLHNYKIITITKKLQKNFFSYLNYYSCMYKQMYHLATSKVCIIDSYCIPVCVLKHKSNLVVIQVWHAMGAIKQFGYQTIGKKDGRNEKIANWMCMHKNYDYIVSGSKAMIPYFSEAFNADKKQFIVNGLPRIDYILENKKLLNKKIKKDYPDLKNKKNILYVPTFRTTEEVKINELIKSINYDKFNLIIKLHPATNKNINSKKVFQCKNYSSLQLLSIADYVITDYSAISIEAASLNIPIFLYLYDYEEYKYNNGLNIDLFQEFNKYAFKDAKNLIECLEKEKYDISVVDKYKKKYLDPDFGQYTSKLVDFIESVCSNETNNS